MHYRWDLSTKLPFVGHPPFLAKDTERRENIWEQRGEGNVPKRAQRRNKKQWEVSRAEQVLTITQIQESIKTLQYTGLGNTEHSNTDAEWWQTRRLGQPSFLAKMSSHIFTSSPCEQVHGSTSTTTILASRPAHREWEKLAVV